MRVDSALLVLRAFRRLSNTYGFFRVDEKMVRMNQHNELKIWMNANPAAFHIEQFLDFEEAMLADITHILMKYDSETAGLMVGCKTFNECMNAILMSLSKNWAESQISTRTNVYSSNRNQQQPSDDCKNIFRSTKETSD